MEAALTSVYVSNLPSTKAILTSISPTLSSSSSCFLCHSQAKRITKLRHTEGSNHGFLRLHALYNNKEGANESEDSKGFDLLPGDIFSLSQEKFESNLSSVKDSAIIDVETSLAVPHGGGTRNRLFRTPISGGVQSATSAHGLPRPALAVRNLMEQGKGIKFSSFQFVPFKLLIRNTSKFLSSVCVLGVTVYGFKARFAHLCTVMSKMHHRREGYPFGSLVDFAPDPMGHPIFSFSPLAIHTRNILAEPRCTLVVQIPGWSCLSNARVMLFGDVYPLPEDQQEWAHKQYIAKHHQGPSQQWGNFHYFRMQNISDIYFIGGFGTVAWINVNEYEALQPDKIAVDGGEQNLKELNAIFSKPLRELLSTESEVDDAAIISIDSKGIDIRVRQGAQFNLQRLAFELSHGVETLEEAKSALWKLIEKGKLHNFRK